MKKYEYIIYDNEGFLFNSGYNPENNIKDYTEFNGFYNTFEEAEKQAINYIGKAIESSKTNFESCFISGYSINEIEI